jgi:hypothetical protein
MAGKLAPGTFLPFSDDPPEAGRVNPPGNTRKEK